MSLALDLGYHSRGASGVSDATPTDEEFADLIGQTLDGRYRIEQILGTGGMGGVLRAVHVGLKNDVAVKVLRARFGDSGETAKRFEREAHSASKLDHPNCVRVTDFGSTADGRRYLVMPFLDGQELYDLLGERFEPARALELAAQLFRGLAHAHRQGVVHRDLKPANVFVTFDDRDQETIKLVDFGIAKLVNDSVFDENLTRAGVIFGTPRYMSPEQASGGKVDARTDVYSGGLLLYQMLAGHPPFEADDAPTLLRMHMIAPPPPLPEDIPRALRELVMRLLEKMPADRPQSADEVVDALEQIRPTLAAASPEPAPARAGSSATLVYGVSDGPGPQPESATPPLPPGPSLPPAAPPTGSPSSLTVRAMPPAPVARRKPSDAALYVIAACVGAGLVVFMIVAGLRLAGDDEHGTTEGEEDEAVSSSPDVEPPSKPGEKKRDDEKKRSKKKRNEKRKRDDENKPIWRFERE